MRIASLRESKIESRKYRDGKKSKIESTLRFESIKGNRESKIVSRKYRDGKSSVCHYTLSTFDSRFLRSLDFRFSTLVFYAPPTIRIAPVEPSISISSPVFKVFSKPVTLTIHGLPISRLTMAL